MPLFPKLADSPCGYLNLDDFAKTARYPDPEYRENLFLDPQKAWACIRAYHERVGIAWSYGGYLERRDTLWKGIAYMHERNTFLHLGVDFNVSPGTLVSLTRPGMVVRIDNDHPEPYGWGTRVIVELKNYPLLLIYAHLGEKPACRLGENLNSNSVIGSVGEAPFNGGWFPHLHVQAMTLRAYEFYKPRMSELDGYGKIPEQAALARMFPDPMPYLRVW